MLAGLRGGVTALRRTAPRRFMCSVAPPAEGGAPATASAANPFLGVAVPEATPAAAGAPGASGHQGRVKCWARAKVSTLARRAAATAIDKAHLQRKFHPGKTSKSAVANFKQLPVAPKKLRIVANMTLGQYVREAMVQLEFGRKNTGIMVKNAIAHAVRLAMEKGLDATRLVVDTASVGKGQYIKRLDYKSRGRVGTRKQYASNLYLTVKEVSVEEVEATKSHGRWTNASKTLKAPWDERVAALPRYEHIEGYEPGEHRYRHPLVHRDGSDAEPNVPTFR